MVIPRSEQFKFLTDRSKVFRVFFMAASHSRACHPFVAYMSIYLAVFQGFETVPLPLTIVGLASQALYGRRSVGVRPVAAHG
jgi:hypothetical protein